ncbi:hypothetical protein KGD01_002581 [Enterococcus faecium]|uniref:ABC-three component system protein n=1 Tax=Enterococcus durans TaxID=53345 RepID=UPI001A0E092C|nr:hypothetical protein [Enterococcus faecium]EGP5742071.1 hypothetical protein [Enterococcus faecium]EMF0291142.1 hypothetical protein [Enterococcus faecium]EMF0382891.1 hypothetical protein [Enterococcus faecium]
MLLNEYVSVLFNNSGSEHKISDFFLELVDNYMEEPRNQESRKQYDDGKYNPFRTLEMDTVDRYFKDSPNTPAVKNIQTVYNRKDEIKFAAYIKNLKLNSTNQENILNEFENASSSFGEEQKFEYGCAILFTEVLKDIIDGNAHTYLDSQLPSVSATKSQKSLVPLKEAYYDKKSGKVVFASGEIEVPKEIAPPDDICEHELNYINCLLAAYSEFTRKSLTAETLPERFKQDFIDQRKNFYSAEWVERIAREKFDDDGETAEIWKGDTYEFISSTLSMMYPNAYQRMLEVMREAVKCQTTSAIEEFKNIMRPTSRKGVCHILANEGRLKWVDEYED